MDQPTKASIVKAPGLKWRARERGRVAYWLPPADAVKAGYPSKSVPLESYQNDPDALVARCKSLQGDLEQWLDGYRRNRSEYDGSIASVLRLYETHAQSPFRALKPSSRVPYVNYLRRVTGHVGGRRVASVIGLDVQEWFRVWSRDGETPAAAQMALAVLKAALTFSLVCGNRECQPLRDVIALMHFPSTRPRTEIASAADIVAARKAAHANGRPLRALCYALQFETLLRQWDVRGQWVPLSYPVTTDVIAGDQKWFGLSWHNISASNVLRYRPSKTDKTTGKEIVTDLALCPMVLEEIAHVPEHARVGPMILNERTGEPYRTVAFVRGWRLDRDLAGLSRKLWNRDLRASAITEAREGSQPASLDDTARAASHADKRVTATVYDRASLDAARRVQTARLASRKGE